MHSKTFSAPNVAVLGLATCFAWDRIFEDTNGDGYPDRLGLAVGVQSGLNEACLWAQLLNLTARLAFEVTALDLPVVKPIRQIDSADAALLVRRPSPGNRCPAEMRRIGSNQIELVGFSAETMAAVVSQLASADSAGTRLPEDWAVLRMVDQAGHEMVILDPAGNQLGTVQLPAGLQPAAERVRQPPPQSIDLLDLLSSCYQSPPQEPRARRLDLGLHVNPRRVSHAVGLALAEFVARAALEATELTLPLASAEAAPAKGVILQVWEDRSSAASVSARIEQQRCREDATVVIRALGPTTSLARCLRKWGRIAMQPDGPGCELRERSRAALSSLQELIHDPHFPAHSQPQKAVPVLRRWTAWPSETREITKIARQVPAGTGKLEGLILASKPIEIRRHLKLEIETILHAKGYTPSLTVLNAYKPGLSWLLEVVQNRLQHAGNISEIELAYRPFGPRRDALEMRSRWLQEIFPGPDLLAESLGWTPERIRLVCRPRMRSTYRIVARNSNGAVVLSEAFTPRVSQLPYLHGRPVMGLVHPTCGGIQLRQGKRILVDRHVPTDREVFWNIFQTRWLPDLESNMAARIDNPPASCPPAFWHNVRIEVTLEESDLRLGLDQERVCPMEALHEDLYFVLLDFFQAFRREHRLPERAQFGRILPVVSASSVRANGPMAKMTARPLVWNAFQAVGRRNRRLHPLALAFVRSQIKLEMACSRRFNHAKRLALSASAKARRLNLDLDVKTRRLVLRLHAPKPPDARTNIPAAFQKPPQERLLSSREILDWTHRLGRLPHLSAWQAGATWQGRSIWVLEAVLQSGGHVVSLAKLRLLKPTLLLNARHHANEVSSTQAALSLAWRVSATQSGRNVLKRANLAIIPMENADGVATLEELLPGAGDHKLHAARYNALGVEWYGDYLKDCPRFPEAQVKPRIWRRWLPIIILDAHGVPSHEWEQPFSGYAPYRFRQYWIPRSFVYAVIPFVNQPDHPAHETAAALVHRMSQALSRETDIVALNRDLGDRYQRYARIPEPATFPPQTADPLVVVPPEKRIADTIFGANHWPVTRAEVITEVVDEVVSGTWLELCVRAHQRIAETLIDWMIQSTPRGEIERTTTPDGRLLMKWSCE